MLFMAMQAFGRNPPDRHRSGIAYSFSGSDSRSSFQVIADDDQLWKPAGGKIDSLLFRPRVIARIKTNIRKISLDHMADCPIRKFVMRSSILQFVGLSSERR